MDSQPLVIAYSVPRRRVILYNRTFFLPILTPIRLPGDGRGRSVGAYYSGGLAICIMPKQYKKW